MNLLAACQCGGVKGNSHHDLEGWEENERIVKTMLEYDDEAFAKAFNSDTYFHLIRNQAKYRTTAYLGLKQSYDAKQIDIDSFNKLLTYRYISARIDMLRNFRFTGSLRFMNFCALLTIFSHSKFQSKDKTLTRLFEKYYINSKYRHPEFFYANFFLNGSEHNEDLKASAVSFFRAYKICFG